MKSPDASARSRKEQIIERLRACQRTADEERNAGWPIGSRQTYPKLTENAGLQSRIHKKVQEAIQRFCEGERNVTINFNLRKNDQDGLIREVRMYIQECLESRHAEEIGLDVFKEKKCPYEKSGPAYISAADFHGIRGRAGKIKDLARESSMKLRKKDAGLFIPIEAKDKLAREGWKDVISCTNGTIQTFLKNEYNIDTV